MRSASPYLWVLRTIPSVLVSTSGF
jgi:hypothetical protein